MPKQPKSTKLRKKKRTTPRPFGSGARSNRATSPRGGPAKVALSDLRALLTAKKLAKKTKRKLRP